MISRQEPVLADPVLRPVGKPRLRPRQLLPRVPQQPQAGLKRNAPEGHQHSQIFEHGKFTLEIRPAIIKFVAGGFVGGRRTSNRRGDQDAGKGKLVPAGERFGPVRKARCVERPEKKISRLISREHPPRPIAAIGGRSEPHDEDTGLGVTKGGKGLPPVLFTDEAARRVLR